MSRVEGLRSLLGFLIREAWLGLMCQLGFKFVMWVALLGGDIGMTLTCALMDASLCSHITTGNRAGASLGPDGGHKAKGPPGLVGKCWGKVGERLI